MRNGLAFRDLRLPRLGARRGAPALVPGTWAAPTIAAVGALAEGTTQATFLTPAEALSGDVECAFVVTANEAVTVPDGWVLVGAQGVGTAGAASASRISTFVRRRAAGTPTSTVFGTVTDHIVGRIHLVRGVGDGDPVLAQVGDFVSVTSGVPFSFGAVTTTLPNALILYGLSRPNDAAGAFFSGVTNPNLTGLLELSDAGTTLGLGGGLGSFGGVMPSAGDTGLTTITPAYGGNTGRQTVAFRPRFFPD
jgi:hypothetical protein